MATVDIEHGERRFIRVADGWTKLDTSAAMLSCIAKGFFDDIMWFPQEEFAKGFVVRGIGCNRMTIREDGGHVGIKEHFVHVSQVMDVGLVDDSTLTLLVATELVKGTADVTFDVGNSGEPLSIS